MASIFDSVKSQLGAPPADTLQAVQNIQAATAGKQGETTVPRRTTLAASQAQAETKGQLQDVFQQDQMSKAQQASQAAASEMQFSAENQKLNEQRLNVENTFAQQAGNILQSFKQQGESLDLSKAKARVEQLGFYLRLGNTQYVDKLQAEGHRSRLDTELAFKESLQRSIFAEESDLFDSDMDFRRIMNADSREFSRMLADMDIDFALRVAESEAKQNNTAGIIQGIGGMVSGAAQLGSNYLSTQSSAPGLPATLTGATAGANAVPTIPPSTSSSPFASSSNTRGNV